MESTSQRLFTNKQLLALLMPVVMNSIMNSLVGLLDSVMVSSVSEAAMSGVSLVSTVMSVVFVLLSALTVGGSVLTSQYIGAQKDAEAKHSTGQLILISALVSTVFGLSCALLTRPLLQLCFGSIEADVMENAVTYFYYNAGSFPIIGIGNAVSTIFHCSRNTKVTMRVGILANVVNIVGNYICIYLLKMGVEGVAIPTVVSRIVSAGTLSWLLFKSELPLKPSTRDIFRVDIKIIGKMLRLGLPSALESSIFDMGLVLVMSMITLFGTHHVAAHSAAGVFVNYANVFAFGCNSVSLMVVGQCVGANDMVQLKENVRKLMIIAYVLGNAVAVLLLVFRRQLLGLYTTLSPETVELASQLMVIHLVGMMFVYPTSFFLNGPLRAVNDGVFTMIVSIGSMVLLRIGLSQFLCVELAWGVTGTWVAMICDWLCRSCFFVGRYLSGKWKKNCSLV